MQGHAREPSFAERTAAMILAAVGYLLTASAAARQEYALTKK